MPSAPPPDHHHQRRNLIMCHATTDHSAPVVPLSVVAARLGRTETRVREWIASGIIKAHKAKAGRAPQWFIYESDLADFVPPHKARGVDSFEDLFSRCRHDADTSCWGWTGYTTSNRRPQFQMFGEKRPTTIGRALVMLHLQAGPPTSSMSRMLKPTHVFVSSCGNPACCNPDHHRLTTRSAIAKATCKATPVKRAKLIAAKRRVDLARISLTDRVDIAQGRYSIEEVMSRFGVSRSHAKAMIGGWRGLHKEAAGKIPPRSTTVAPGAWVFSAASSV